MSFGKPLERTYCVIASGVSRAGSTEMNRVCGGVLPAGSRLIALPSLKSVMGQTSAQFVKPKKMSVFRSLKLASVVGEPSCAVRWKGPPISSDQRLVQLAEADGRPAETTPGVASPDLVFPAGVPGVQPARSRKRTRSGPRMAGYAHARLKKPTAA